MLAIPRFEKVVATCVRLVLAPAADKSDAPTASTAATQIMSKGFLVTIEPGVIGEPVPELELDESTVVTKSPPVHSSIIRIPSAPPIVSVTVTALLA